jgi:hypothetical protein
VRERVIHRMSADSGFQARGVEKPTKTSRLEGIPSVVFTTR